MKIVTPAVSVLTPLAAARHTATSCLASLSPCGAFKGSKQQLLPAFMATKRKLTGTGRQTETTF